MKRNTKAGGGPADISRRTALKIIGLGAAALPFAGCAPGLTRRAPGRGDNLLVAADGRDFSPIDRTLGDAVAARFSGDDPERAHRVLWDIQGYLAAKGGIPAPSERVPLVVVGGGMSGIIASYLLRDYKPVVLERAERFGGNARGESWRGIDYSIGAAYFMEQEEGSAIRKLFDEAGIFELCREKDGDDPVAYNGRRYDGFWDGATAPAQRAQFQRLKKYFTDLFNEQNGLRFPEIPAQAGAERATVDKLDRVGFRTHLMRIAGGKLHPHIETVLEHYCWSTFATPFAEVGAASGLNAYASEFGKVYVAPGGNAAVAERFLEKTAAVNPRENFRPGALVFDVRVVSDGVVVAYENAAGELRAIHAKAAVLACPKFVVARILHGMEPARRAAIKRLRYHSYLVANVLLEGRIPDTFYDLYMIGDGTVDTGDAAASARRHGATDIVLGTYARVDTRRSVLTLYRGMPYAGGRAELYAADSYVKYRAEFERQIRDEILPVLGIKADAIADLRLARWGHPMPVPARGLIANGVIDQIRKPFRRRVFFVEQDNWMLPAIEVCANEALTWAPQVRRVLGKL